MFGGNTGESGTSAYMLQYRQYDSSDLQTDLPDDLVPDYLRQEIEAETKLLIEKQEEILENLLRIILKVHEP